MTDLLEQNYNVMHVSHKIEISRKRYESWDSVIRGSCSKQSSSKWNVSYVQYHISI